MYIENTFVLLLTINNDCLFSNKQVTFIIIIIIIIIIIWENINDNILNDSYYIYYINVYYYYYIHVYNIQWKRGPALLLSFTH